VTVVILEGVNGVGKTSQARLLAEELGVKMYRPFRENPDSHFDAAEIENFHDLGIPVNTYVEDCCLADTLVQLGISCVLDRSMPSAIAYAQIDGCEGITPTFAHLDWWQNKLGQHPEGVLVVQMQASLGTIQERLGNNAPVARRAEKLIAAYGKVFQRIQLPKMVINTDICSPRQILMKIKRKLEDDA